MAPLLRGRIASKGSGEDPEGDLSPPGMRRSSPCGRAGLAIDGAPVRRQVRSKRAPCKRQKRPRFCGIISRQREAERIRRANSLSPGYAQKQPLRPCRSCHRRRARPPPGPARPCPLQAEKRPRFCGAVSRQREAERIRRAPSLSPGYAQKQPLRPCRSCVDGARPPPGRKRLCPLQAEKTAPFLRGRFASKGSGEDPEGALSLPRVCAEAAPAAMPVMPSTARPSAARSGANAPLASRKNGPVFAGPFCVKGKRRGSGGRSPSPGRWTRPAPASRPGRRRSRPGGHPRRQSR